MAVYLGLLNCMEPKVFIDIKETVLSNDLLITLFSAIMKPKEITISGNLQSGII